MWFSFRSTSSTFFLVGFSFNSLTTFRQKPRSWSNWVKILYFTWKWVMVCAVHPASVLQICSQRKFNNGFSANFSFSFCLSALFFNFLAFLRLLFQFVHIITSSHYAFVRFSPQHTFSGTSQLESRPKGKAFSIPKHLRPCWCLRGEGTQGFRNFHGEKRRFNFILWRGDPQTKLFGNITAVPFQFGPHRHDASLCIPI